MNQPSSHLSLDVPACSYTLKQVRREKNTPLLLAVVLALVARFASAAEATPETNEFVYVCTDGGAGAYEAFPDVCRLADGRLMAVFYAGYEHVSLPNQRFPSGGRICKTFSTDEGFSWSPPAVLYDGPHDDRDPSIVQLRDGRLLCSFFSLRAKEGGGYSGLGTWLVTSDDLGTTWSEPRLLSADYYCSSPVRELPNGRLILGLYQEKDGQGAGAVVLSEDNGMTWGKVIDIDNGGRRLDAETDVIPLKDGALLAVERSPNESMGFSTSHDGGRTWSVSEQIGFPGHCPYLLRAPGDVLVLAHRVPNTSLHYSTNEAKTWVGPVSVDSHIGAYPSMVNLRDGTILIVYYEEGANSNIRARRFRISAGGVAWLPVVPPSKPLDTVAQTGWGEPSVAVTQEDGRWVIAGKTRKVTLNLTNVQLTVDAGPVRWPLVASWHGDLQVRHAGAARSLRLADAGVKRVQPHETGFQTGVRLQLSDFKHNDTVLDLQIGLALALEGPEEELVCEVVATDGETRVRELCWPPAFDAGAFDATVVPFMQGMFLPINWPKKVRLYDSLSYGRGLYMPWWGHQQRAAAVLVMLETAADGGCRFEHPSGGPTRLDLRWVHSLGQWAYPRRARFCFMGKGDYVQMAKRYRQRMIQRGHFVSLREKIARNTLVGKLIGAPVVHTSILYHIQPESSYYHKDDPAKNHDLVTFDARADQLARLRDKGVTKAYVHLDGWGFRGYDNLHPDVLPPAPEAGGWEGMRRFSETCERLNFVFAIHDQYRDYYLDAKSYWPRLTAVDQNGQRSIHSTWYGGRQSILCPSLAPGHVRKNHAALCAGGVKLRGAYLDVFAVVPPDECYHPDHPVTRTGCLQFRAECLASVRAWGGIASSEEPSDWAIPHLDLVHHGPFALDPDPGHGPAQGVPVPLFNLVYHDALLIPWSMTRGAWGIPEKDLGFLHGLAQAGLPYLSLQPSPEELDRVRTLCALHRRVGLLELTGHRFLDDSRRKQETSYADETRVTIDLDTDKFDVQPPLSKEELEELHRAP